MKIKSFYVAFMAALYFMSSVTIADASVTSTRSDQTAVDITIYQQNLAYISETREVVLEEGLNELNLADVPRYIQADTITLDAAKSGNILQIVEQSYLTDVMETNRLLDAYVGKQVKIMQWNEYQDRHEIKEAKLLSNQDNKIFEINGEIYLGHAGTIILPEVPDNFVASPTLRFLYDSSRGGRETLDMAYLTGGLSWQANYQLSMDEKMRYGDLKAWVTLTNGSETEFKNATVRVLAGDLNQTTAPRRPAPVKAMRAMMMAEDSFGGGFQQSGVADYYQFKLERPVTLKNHETKQIQLFEAKIPSMIRVYRVQHGAALNLMYRNQQKQKLPVNTVLEFDNDRVNGLGRPLPQGSVRFFTKSADGQRTYLGADQVQHTPEGDRIEWVVGSAFDLKAERQQMNYSEVTRHVRETDWQVELRNQKGEEVQIEVLETLQGDWRILSSSHEYEKVNSSTVKFVVTVPAKSSVNLTYGVTTGK